LAKITTTIRWDQDDLSAVKKAAKKIGLPVSLFVKSLVLTKINETNYQPTPKLLSDLLSAKQDLENGDFEIFESPEDFLKDLNSKISK